MQLTQGSSFFKEKNCLRRDSNPRHTCTAYQAYALPAELPGWGRITHSKQHNSKRLNQKNRLTLTYVCIVTNTEHCRFKFHSKEQRVWAFHIHSLCLCLVTTTYTGSLITPVYYTSSLGRQYTYMYNNTVRFKLGSGILLRYIGLCSLWWMNITVLKPQLPRVCKSRP